MRFLTRAMSARASKEPWCGERFVVTGGFLKGASVWVPPHVESVQAVKYIELRGQDATLCRFMGLPKGTIRPNSMSFLTHLREMRNDAVRPHALKWYQEKVDAYCQKLDLRAMGKVMVDDLPDSVCVDCEGHALSMRTTTSIKRNVALLATPENLNAFIKISRLFHDEGSRRKPPAKKQVPRSMKTRFDSVSSHAASMQVRVFYRQGGEHGNKRRRKHSFAFTDRESCAAATRDAINFLRQNHHVPTDDGMALASSVAEDMFAADGELAAWASRDCEPGEEEHLLQNQSESEGDSSEEGSQES